MAKLQVGKKIKIKGWVYRKRSSGGLIFVIVRNSQGIIQSVIAKDKVDEKSWKEANATDIESSVEVEGVLQKEERAPTGYEIKVEKFRNIAIAQPFPITEYQSEDFLLDNRHLWLRSLKMQNIMKIRALVFKYFREFFEKQKFYEVSPPIITKAGCEGGSTLFPIKYFDDKAYLTQSSQLYLEVLITSLEKVYCIAPSFRAEKSRTVKHLAEYWHLEAEMAYFNNEQNMKLQEKMISYVCQKIAKHEELLNFFKVEASYLKSIKPPFKRITYEEALDFLNSHGMKKKWLDDIGAEDEKILTKDEDKPVFIYAWPYKMKAFYMARDPKNPELALCADLQAPHGHGEIIGGSERIWKLEELLNSLKEFKLNEKDYYWYIDLRKYGSVPHSGFGLGIERFIKWILNLNHIRDAIPFPRVINRVEP
jgi:asparaginyl-tRNA synthetase